VWVERTVAGQYPGLDSTRPGGAGGGEAVVDADSGGQPGPGPGQGQRGQPTEAGTDSPEGLGGKPAAGELGQPGPPV
jgi:hypothetical protein